MPPKKERPRNAASVAKGLPIHLSYKVSVMYQQQISPSTQSDTPRRRKRDFYERERRLRKFTADLPFAVHDEKHGWGLVVRPPHGGRFHDLSMYSGWHMVWYAHGLECRTIIPDEGTTEFFTWEAVGKYVSKEQEWHLSRRQAYVCQKSWRYDWRPAWRLIYKMWG
jgi:hypothetical protein